MAIYCGVDFHARQQTIRFCDTADGEACLTTGGTLIMVAHQLGRRSNLKHCPISVGQRCSNNYNCSTRSFEVVFIE